jgi:hypothetical protein
MASIPREEIEFVIIDFRYAQGMQYAGNRAEHYSKLKALLEFPQLLRDLQFLGDLPRLVRMRH